MSLRLEFFDIEMSGGQVERPAVVVDESTDECLVLPSELGHELRELVEAER